MTQHIQIQDKFQGNAWFCNVMFESRDRTSLIDETRKILLDLVARTRVIVPFHQRPFRGGLDCFCWVCLVRCCDSNMMLQNQTLP